MEPEHAIGKDTIEALQAGAVYGFAGQVDGIAEGHLGGARHADRGSSRPAASPALIAPHSTAISEVDPYLTLRGIELIMRRQQRV